MDLQTAVREPSSQSAKSDNKQVRSRRPLFLTLGAVIIVVGLLYLFRDKFIAATVNGQMISRAELVSELEKQHGQTVLDTLVTKTLVDQEAKKRGITVSNEELDAELKKIEERFTSQQQNLDQVLESQGYSRSDLNEQVRLQLLVEKMVADKIQVSDEEVAKYMKDNTQFLAKDKTPDQQKEEAKNDVRQEKVNQEAQQLLQDLKQKASIIYFSSRPVSPVPPQQ